uniref:Methyltransferase domain-containing protein n=1 Tax=viral metagenome TaxID=1070528 RepID=A0A6C0HZY2_9ZZZZ
MNYIITHQILSSPAYNEYYKNIVINETDIFDKSGKEHYHLLSYLSTLFNNSNIIDIGTHMGHSAIALAYNKTNTIYSFDIVDKIHSSYKIIDNIKYVYDNLFDTDEIRNKWKDIILSCPFIFLDVDPHNGTMEYDIIQYLKSIDYKGFVICDDIWYFKEMRDHFWYKIEPQYKYDLTEFGHWSGTGVITFNENITFNNYNNSNWTLVTAYFNLTKCLDASEEINKRGFEYYLSHSISTLSMPYNLVIYCDEESLEEIKKIRPAFLADKTEYIIWDFEKIQFIKNGSPLNETFGDYRQKINNNRNEKPYHFDNRNTASYYLFCLSRYAMLKDTITRNTFKSTHFCWINFCIERMGYKNLIRLDEALSVNRDKFSTCYIDYIPKSLIDDVSEYYKWGRCSMCSGFFTGNSTYMYNVCDLIENKFLHYMQLGYGHADEQLYSPVYFDHPELFDHYYGDYQQMITNYRYIYDSPEPPIYNFIKNSYQNANYVKCFEGCKFVWNSYVLDKCTINDDYLQKLYWYYMNCKKQLKIIN